MALLSHDLPPGPQYGLLAEFERVDDLRAVRGIGPRLLERLRPCVRIGATKVPSAAPSAPRAGAGR